ncbi:MAG: response regulator transcription factor [Lachnospiraceae bacterium]|nr:response regulator transcription factor [Lachnospiraceae bacterium]MBQ5851446.1 response regulator transcription factor [Lachnospiraceae bacterium]
MTLQECKILLVDDEAALLQMVGNLLNKEGYHNVDTAGDCREAIRLTEKNDYQLAILDVMLPDGDGFTLFEKIKEIKGNGLPVIFLSARDEDSARLRGLGLGADDYIAKPFLPEELLLRLRAVLKRTYHIDDTIQTEKIGKAYIDWGAGSIKADGEDYMLTAKEYALLKKLSENKGRILSINVLCDTLWPDGSYGYENSLMVHIRHLREKLEENPSKPEHLVTVRGLGYKLK